MCMNKERGGIKIFYILVPYLLIKLQTPIVTVITLIQDEQVYFPVQVEDLFFFK